MTDAHALLLTGESILSANATFHFNLACYECLLGNFEEAKRRLMDAIRLNPDYRLAALRDEDWQPLWDSLGSSDAD